MWKNQKRTQKTIRKFETMTTKKTTNTGKQHGPNPWVQTPYNAHLRKDKRKISTLPSLTVPDETMTPRQILERYANGLPVMGDNSQPQYYGEEALGIDPRTLDLSEQQEILSIRDSVSFTPPVKENKEDKNTVREDDKGTGDVSPDLQNEAE